MIDVKVPVRTYLDNTDLYRVSLFESTYFRSKLVINQVIKIREIRKEDIVYYQYSNSSKYLIYKFKTEEEAIQFKLKYL